MVIFPAMRPQFLHAFKNLEFRQVVCYSAHLSRSLAQFLAHIAEIVVLPIMKIEFIDIVKPAIRAEPALRMSFFDVSLQRLIPIKNLFEQKQWLAFNAEFAEVDFVLLHIVVSQNFDACKLPLCLLVLINTQLAESPNFLADLGPDFLPCEDQALLVVFNSLTPLACSKIV